MMVGGSSLRADKACSTSRPLMLGMRKSNSTTSGLMRGMSCTACTPSAHSATTRMSSARSSKERTPWRTRFWSSTRQTEIIAGPSQQEWLVGAIWHSGKSSGQAQCGRLETGRRVRQHRRLAQWKTDAEGKTLPYFALHGHAATEFGQALAHAGETVAGRNVVGTAAV